MPNKASHVLFLLIFGFVWPAIALPQVTVRPNSWQTSTQVSVLPVPSDSLQAKLFYAVLPANVTPSDGKEGWIEIKCSHANYICFAKWRDWGHSALPDDISKPDNNVPNGSLCISTAVANYLHSEDPHSLLQWRVVDGDDVHPGMWLKEEEQSIILTAIREADSTKGGSTVPQNELAKLRALYLNMYLKINEAEQYEKKDTVKKATEAFAQALSQLETIQRMAPSWEQVLVSKRIEDVIAQVLSLNK